MHSLFPAKTGKTILALLICVLLLGGFQNVTFADPPPISTGVNISAQVNPSASIVPPTVVTLTPLVTVSDTTATLLGDLALVGDSPVVSEGFRYGPTTAYGITTTSTSLSGFGTGQFSANITGITCEQTYHYQAYAQNDAGVSYGTDETFSTSACSTIVPLPTQSPGHSGAAILATSSTVNFSGRTFPGAVVTILRDGVVVTTVLTGSDGSFLSTLTGVDAGSYVFSLYVTDQKGAVSASDAFPFVINGKSVVNITNIVFSPTIATDKLVIQKGAMLTVSGYAEPGSAVTISSKQFPYTYGATADQDGLYTAKLDLSMLSIGAYTLHAVATKNGQSTPSSKGKIVLIGLSVGTGTKTGAGGVCTEGDLNCDGRVDIVDYSIMKYWYKKQNPPAAVDLSHDGIVNLKDFSILAADWTG